MKGFVLSAAALTCFTVGAQPNEFAYSRSELPLVAQMLKSRLETCRIITFTGPHGVGKTELISELLNQCGVNRVLNNNFVGGPREYWDDSGHQLVHFDLRSVRSEDQLEQFGCIKYFYNQRYTLLVEWPQAIMPLIPNEGVCHVTIRFTNNPNTRFIRFS